MLTGLVLTFGGSHPVPQIHAPAEGGPPSVAASPAPGDTDGVLSLLRQWMQVAEVRP
ncbi:hypothetical protein [Streptomyces sp. NPDC046197]|uniref:hypothetical protein n=1 Tax=Streptomyces sp. NPDC046197 TaxID=3154337 RepID=UPI0033C1E6A2